MVVEFSTNKKSDLFLDITKIVYAPTLRKLNGYSNGRLQFSIPCENFKYFNVLGLFNVKALLCNGEPIAYHNVSKCSLKGNMLYLYYTDNISYQEYLNRFDYHKLKEFSLEVK